MMERCRYVLTYVVRYIIECFCFFFLFFFSPTNYVNRGASFFRFQLRSNFLKLKQLKERRISLRFFRFVFLEKINMDISNT